MKTLADWHKQPDPVALLDHVPDRKGQARRCRHFAAEVLRGLARLEIGPVLESLPGVGYFRDGVQSAARRNRKRGGEAARRLNLAIAALDGDTGGHPGEAASHCLRHDSCRWVHVGVPAFISDGVAGWPSAAQHILFSYSTPTQVARTVRVAEWLASATPGDTAAIVLYKRSLAHLVRDVFLPPATLDGTLPRHTRFRPAWRTDTVVSIADAMRDAGDFSAMPILADALQDAGCDREDVLSHCRARDDYGDLLPHCRACWVLEAILPPTV